MDTVALLLTTAFRHVINEPNIETGYERFAALIDTAVDESAFRDAVATCLRDKLIREPIRLPEGALQCHWHLELTPKGVAAARALLDEGAQRRTAFRVWLWPRAALKPSRCARPLRGCGA